VKHIVELIVIFVTVLVCGAVAEAGQAKVYRVGVIHQGGPYKAVVDGLRDGLRQSGMEEGKHFVLDIRDAKGDLKAVEEAARNFEREKANLIYAVTTSVATVVKNCYLEEPNCFRRRQRPGRQRTGAELWETWRKTYGRSVFGHGSHGEAAGNSKGDAAKTQPRGHHLQP
jgi:ABC transporter substrate binding protein